MVRVSDDEYDAIVHKPHVRPMDFTGRPLRGFVYVSPPGFRTAALRTWLSRGERVAEEKAAQPARPPAVEDTFRRGARPDLAGLPVALNEASPAGTVVREPSFVSCGPDTRLDPMSVRRFDRRTSRTVILSRTLER